MADTYHAELGVLVAVGLIGVALWIWMAQMNQAGKNWARITSTVFFALETLSAIGGLAGGALPGGSVNRFYGLLVWVIGGGRDHPALAAPVDGLLQGRAALTAFVSLFPLSVQRGRRGPQRALSPTPATPNAPGRLARDTDAISCIGDGRRSCGASRQDRPGSHSGPLPGRAAPDDDPRRGDGDDHPDVARPVMLAQVGAAVLGAHLLGERVVGIGGDLRVAA